MNTNGILPDMLIITGSDNNYVPGVLVLIASAAFHNPGARFAVLDMGISPENRDRIDRLSKQVGVEISRIEVPANAFDRLLVKRGHLTRSTYLRLLIPDLFPSEDRAIYMDCDMVVMGDLSLLQDIDLSQNVIAAVPCPSPDPVEVAATGHVMGSYVNAGLLVMNLPVWRREQVAVHCMELLSDPSHPLLSEDQSAINIVAKGRTRLLPAHFNVYSDPASYNCTDDFPESPTVVHYVVNNKPWNGPTNMGRIWQFHAGRISDLMPPVQPVSLARRLSLLNRKRKFLIGRLTGSRKYRVRHWMMRHMDDCVTEVYLAAAKAAS